MALAIAAATLAMTMPSSVSRPASATVSLLSPYRRPAYLQPRRLFAEAYALYGQAVFARNGVPLATLGVDTEIRETERRGKGLFALRDFEPGELVARYSGVIATREQYHEAWYEGRTSGRYTAKVTADGSVVVDAESASCPGRFVNHSKLWKNCEITSFCMGAEDDEQPTGLCFIATTAPVAAGSEFLVDYGDDYWRSEAAVPGVPRFLRRIQVDYLR